MNISRTANRSDTRQTLLDSKLKTEQEKLWLISDRHLVTGLVKILTLKSLNRVLKDFKWPDESNIVKFVFLVSKYVFYVCFGENVKKSM